MDQRFIWIPRPANDPVRSASPVAVAETAETQEDVSHFAADLPEDLLQFAADWEAARQSLHVRLDGSRLSRTPLTSTIRFEDIQEAQEMQRQEEEEEEEEEEVENDQNHFVPLISHLELGEYGPPENAARQTHEGALHELREHLVEATDDDLLALHSLLNQEVDRRHSFNSFGFDSDSELDIPRPHNIETVQDGSTPLLPDPEFDPWFEHFLDSLPTVQMDPSGSQLTRSDFRPVDIEVVVEATERWERATAPLTNHRRRIWRQWWPWTVRRFHTVVHDGDLVAFVRVVEDGEEDEEEYEQKYRRWKEGWRWMYQMQPVLAVAGLFRLAIIGLYWIYD